MVDKDIVYTVLIKNIQKERQPSFTRIRSDRNKSYNSNKKEKGSFIEFYVFFGLSLFLSYLQIWISTSLKFQKINDIIWATLRDPAILFASATLLISTIFELFGKKGKNQIVGKDIIVLAILIACLMFSAMMYVEMQILPEGSEIDMAVMNIIAIILTMGASIFGVHTHK